MVSKDRLYTPAGLKHGLTLHCLIYASQDADFSKSFEVTHWPRIALGFITVKKSLAKSIAGKWDDGANELSEVRG